MADLNRIVNITTILNTKGLKKNEFNTMLFLTTNANTLSPIMEITSAKDVLDLGFNENSKVYNGALAYFAQQPHARVMVLGQVRAGSVTYEIKDNNNLIGSYGFKITFHDKDNNTQNLNISIFNKDSSVKKEALITALIKEVTDKGSNFVKASVDANNKIVITILNAGKIAVNCLGNLEEKNSTPVESYTEALSRIKKLNDYWYGLAIDTDDADIVLKVAQWVEANEKLFGVQVDAKAYDNTVDNDLASRLKAKNYLRTWGIVTKEKTEFANVALFGNRLAYLPGSETWANVSLAGITADDIIEGYYISATNKNVTTYELFGGQVSLTQNGKTFSSEWIDVVRFSDWLKTEIQTNVVSTIINNSKIPYNDTGIHQIATGIYSALNLGKQRGGIDEDALDDKGKVHPSYRVTLPLSANISPNDKASRILKDISVWVRLAGAIHRVEMNLTFSYTLD